MRPSAATAARAFQTKFEGRANCMYLDAECLVTTGIGNKIDPVADAFRLHWLRNGTGATATLNAVQDEWIRVKERTDLAGASFAARKAITTLHLAEEEIDRFFDSETVRMWGQIVGGYPDAEQWPAAAQLGTLSMCWAMGAGRILPGPAFQYPHFRAALLAQSWTIASLECRMNGKGIDGRNAANKALFAFAARGGDPDSLPPL